MSPFVQFLNQQLQRRGWKSAKLAREAKLDPSLVSKGLRDLRPFTAEAVLRLRALLCETDTERAEFDRLYKAAPKRRKHSLYRDLTMDSAVSEIRVASLPFFPFSGEKGFLDKCVTKMMELSFIRIEWENLADPLADDPVFERFSMKERIDWVESGKVDLLFNLVSLQRMKKLEFLVSPIRIGINGVMLLDQMSRIDEASKLLTSGVQAKSNPFRVLVCRHEVGAVYMESSNRLRELDSASPDLQQACLDMVESINPVYLANRMRDTGGEPVLLVCDEHTALNVVRELKGLGLLVLSPNSDQAVIRDQDRRALPAYYFGLGIRRHFNNPLIEFLRQNMRAFLSAEPENIAFWMEDAYLSLVRHLTACLSKTNIFIGGLLRTDRRFDDSPPPEAHAGTWRGVHQTMVQQNARAVALRCFNLSRRLLETLPDELEPWRPILERTRERLQITESGDRGRLRYIILYCAKMALCEDPLSPIPDPIELLRRLVPSYEKDAGDSPKDLTAGFVVSEAEAPETPVDSWPSFLRLMERELDADLSSLLDCPEREFFESSDLGRLITRIQKLSESSRDTEALVLVRRYSDVDREQFLQLRREYELERGRKLGELELVADLASDLSSGERGRTWRFIAYSLGCPVGFIEGILGEVSLYPGIPSAKTEMLQIKHLHVATHVHNAGVSRRLIRKMIEKANEEKLAGLWIYIWDLENKKGQEERDREKFERAGFVRFREDRLWYELLQESGAKRLYPARLKPKLT